MTKPALLISACLLGTPCRYDGKSVPLESTYLTSLGEKYRLVPVCPEQLGGLPTPRLPSEIRGVEVVRRDGENVTANYSLGARKALEIAVQSGCTLALLKEKSPSCGAYFIYDGSFSGKLMPGMGVTAKLLSQNGIEVFGESAVLSLKRK